MRGDDHEVVAGVADGRAGIDAGAADRRAVPQWASLPVTRWRSTSGTAEPTASVIG